MRFLGWLFWIGLGLVAAFEVGFWGVLGAAVGCTIWYALTRPRVVVHTTHTELEHLAVSEASARHATAAVMLHKAAKAAAQAGQLSAEQSHLSQIEPAAEMHNDGRWRCGGCGALNESAGATRCRRCLVRRS